MRSRKCLFLSLVVSLSVSACATRRPSLTLQTSGYVVIQTSPDRFLILTKSNAAMKEISKQLGCDDQHVCAGSWSGEMWTIERFNSH